MNDLIASEQRDGADASVTMEPLDLATLVRPLRLLEGARLYLVARDSDGALGVRRFLAILAADSAVHPLTAPGVAFLLVAESVGTRAPAVTTDSVTIQSSVAWFDALLAAEIFAASPTDAALVEPGQELAATTPTVLSSRSLVWVRADEPVLSLMPAVTGLAAPEICCLPLSPGRGLRLTRPARVTVVETDALADTELAAAVDHIGGLAGQWHIASVVSEAERRHVSRARDDQDFNQALRVINDTIHGVPTQATRESGAVADPLDRALMSVAAAEGITLRPVPMGATAADWRDRLADMAAIANFRTRRVTLDGTWWREEGPSLIVEDMATGAPRALLGSRKGYRLAEPETGQRRLTKQEADGFVGDAVMLYPSLPEHVGGRELLAFATHGIGSDIWRLVVASAAVSVLGLITPVATGLLIGTAIPDGRLGLVQQMVLGLVAAAIGAATFEIGSALAQMRVATHIDWRLQAAVWDRVMRLPTGFFRDYSVGDLATRIRAVDDIRRTLGWVTINGVIGGIWSLCCLALMLAYDLRLGLLACAYAVALAVLLFVIKTKRERLLRDYSTHRGIVSGLILQLLDGIRKLRVAAAESRAFVRWARAFALQRATSAQDGRLVNFQSVLVDGAPVLGTLAAFAIAADREPMIDVATFAAFSAAFAQFTEAVWTFANALAVSTIVIPMAGRLRPILDAQPEVEDARVDPGPLSGRIAMRNVSFRYGEEGPWILENIDFDVEPGAFVAIVGPSGSGKSTLLRLLLGFETPRRGSVFYDQQDLAKLDLRLVRRQIGTVLQSTGLVPGTLYENIAGSSMMSRAEVMEAATKAGLADDLAAMPMGLETVVSEGASTLSGGQRQRVMIARALLRKPRILLFDEATSALDNRTQAVVSESLSKLSATRLVIAHRLSTIRNADMILVMEGGRIVERGCFEELMTAQGAFHRLASRQML